MVVIPRLRAYHGPALFSYGYRPFFLAGAAYAGIGILLWLALFFGDIELPTAFAPVDWHVHEMLYGYLPAVMTGFLLTSIPNWTGKLPLQGAPLALLAAIWLAGRLAVLFSAVIGTMLAAGIDLLFLVLIATAAAREVLAGRNWRNLPAVGILGVFIVGNAVFHIEADGGGPAEFGKRIGIAAAIALIVLIGGRVIPSFTRNWLARENPGRLPAPLGRFDLIAIGTAIVALLLWIAMPAGRVTAALMLVACALHTVRLIRWSGDRTLRERLVVILHIGYAFVPLGFLLLAGAILWPQDVPISAGIHAWTVGAVGILTLAMMTRVSLSHGGRKPLAGPMTQLIYAAVLIAALVRIGAAFWPDLSLVLLQIAGGAWALGFFAFAAFYGHLLARLPVGRSRGGASRGI